MWKPVRFGRLHGRHEARGRTCDAAGCQEAGEFRAPGGRPPSHEGPGEYRWFCLDHIRAFNAGYDYFEGMTSEEILRAQSPMAGWERESRAFRPTAGIDSAPRWADFVDPLDAISGRARNLRRERWEEQAGGQRFNAEERRALEMLGLSQTADRADLRARYSQLVRKYHPDRNGGDRSMEKRLRQVVEAYQLLRKAAAFA